jgi:hypothetical protein
MLGFTCRHIRQQGCDDSVQRHLTLYIAQSLVLLLLQVLSSFVHQAVFALKQGATQQDQQKPLASWGRQA